MSIIIRMVKYFNLDNPKSIEEIMEMSVPKQNETLRNYISQCSSDFVGVDTLRRKWAKEHLKNCSIDLAKQKAILQELSEDWKSEFEGPSPWGTFEKWGSEKSWINKIKTIQCHSETCSLVDEKRTRSTTTNQAMTFLPNMGSSSTPVRRVLHQRRENLLSY